MSLKEILTEGYTFVSYCELSRLIILNLIHQKKRVAVRKNFLDLFYI